MLNILFLMLLIDISFRAIQWYEFFVAVESFYCGLKNVSPVNMILLKRALRLSKPELLGNSINLQNAYEYETLAH